MATDLGKAEIFYADEAVIVGAWQDVFFQRWRGPGGVASIRSMHRAHERFLKGRPPRTTLSFSHVEGASMKPPEEAGRASMKEHIALLSERARAATTVIESAGFGSAIIRSVVSGLVLVSKRGLPHEVFSSPKEGFDFLLRHRSPAGTGVTAAELEALYRRSFSS